MKALGYALTWLGFLAAAFVSVARVEGVGWASFAVALGVGVAGVALVRWRIYREASHEDKLVADVAVLADSLRGALTAVTAIDADKTKLSVYDLHHRIDGEVRDHLTTFAEARESIAFRFGLAAYGEVMTHFASGERHLNRVWSASTDGYVDEAHDYLGRAREQLEAALGVFRRLGGPQPEPPT